MLEEDELVRIGQGTTQEMQLAAEVGQRLGVARLGQHGRQLAAGDGPIVVQDQVGDKAFELGALWTPSIRCPLTHLNRPNSSTTTRSLIVPRRIPRTGGAPDIVDR